MIPFTSSFAGDSNGNFIVTTEDGILSIHPEGKTNWINSNVQQITKGVFTKTNIVQIVTDECGGVFVESKDHILYALGSDVKLFGKRKRRATSLLRKGMSNYLQMVFMCMNL